MAGETEQGETSLTLDNTKDYERGDNSDIVATDSQKNTVNTLVYCTLYNEINTQVFVLAKQFGIASPEEFGLLLVR